MISRSPRKQMSEWNTIESDAGVFTELIEKLGVTGAEFEELLSVDSESLRQIGPLYGVIFLFKYRRSESSKPTDKPQAGDYDYDTSVFFAHQKIQNACATQAVLSLILNNEKSLNVGKELSDFKEFVESFDADLKGETISNSNTIRSVHNSFSRPNPFVDDSEQAPPDEEDDGLYHFIAYVPCGGQLYELDGLQPYPISHGECNSEEFYDKLPQVLTQRISRAPEGEMRFNLLALTQDKRIVLNALGDMEGLRREELKREAWKRENLLRRENFIALIYELVRGIASKSTDEEWESAIERGRTEYKRQVMAKNQRSHR